LSFPYSIVFSRLGYRRQSALSRAAHVVQLSIAAWLLAAGRAPIALLIQPLMPPDIGFAGRPTCLSFCFRSLTISGDIFEVLKKFALFFF